MFLCLKLGEQNKNPALMHFSLVIHLVLLNLFALKSHYTPMNISMYIFVFYICRGWPVE